jgi:hypothetical protein
MFTGSEYTFKEMVLIWTIVTAIWGVSLLVALKLAHIELTPMEKWITILLTSLTALFPAIGLFLAPVVASYLIYRMADAQLPIVIGVVVITRFIAAMVAIWIEKALVAIGL